MEFDILDALEEVGYKGNCANETTLEKAVEVGPKSTEYTGLIEWICKELKVLCKLEETVNSIISDDDTSSFLLEISSFLKELGCCYSTLTEGHLSERLNTKEKRLLLIDYLLTELMAARMIRSDKPHLNKGIELKLEETSTSADLKSLLIALKFRKPPDNITPEMLFSKVEQKLKEVIKEAPPELVGNPLFKGKLSDKQWHTLGEIQAELEEEYHVRREMLIKRLDVTIQSFQWSERAKKNENEIISKYNAIRSKMVTKPNVTLADLLAARDDLAIIEKTSNASVRKNTQSSINKVIIGRVPDRGGRPSEQAAPPPEMPSWQKDRAPSGGGGRGGGGRGGRVQGGWNQGNQRQDYQDNRSGGGDNRGGYHNRGGCNDNRGYQDNRGGYQDNRGGYQGNRGVYQDNRGGYQDNRGGYLDNRGGYQDNRGGYQDNRGGYLDNRGGYQDNRGGYQDNRGGYQDNRGGYQGSRGGHQGGRGGYRDRGGHRGGKRDYR